MSREIALQPQSRLRTLKGVRIIGTGSYLPENVVTNEDLIGLGCDPDWIVQRTGILERRHAPQDMTTGEMATEAARRCIEAAEVDPQEVDLLVLGTFTPDVLMPATACAVQNQLGLQCAAADVNAACAGFLYALITAGQFIAAGGSDLALVIGADCNTRVLNRDDPKTFPLFGDGAGAVLLRRGDAEQGLLSYLLGADGSGRDLLYRPVGGTEVPLGEGECVQANHFVQMNGRPVFKWAVRLLEQTSLEVLAGAGLQKEDIDLWIYHQANARILDAAANALGIEQQRLVKHLDRYGNTSAASVPIALDEAVRAGQIRPGSQLVLSGFGAGLAWGTAVVRW